MSRKRVRKIMHTGPRTSAHLCMYHHNFKYLYRCLQNYKSSYRQEVSKSPAKDKSAPNAEEGRTRGKHAKTVVSGSFPATKSEQETGTKYFKGFSAHWNYLHYLCNMGVLFFLPKYLFLVMTLHLYNLYIRIWSHEM